MEKDRAGRFMAVAALVVGIVGLSLGFAAYSSTFRIDTTANVTVNNNWNVGFSTNGTDIENVTTPGTKAGVSVGTGSSGGSVNVTKYTIAQGTNATLKTESGSQVTYTLDILNKGSISAYLDSVNFSGVTLTCTNVAAGTGSVIEGVAGAGTTSTGGNTTTISNADCAKMFAVSLSIGGTEYTATSSPKTTLAANSSAPVVLKLAYKGDAQADAVADTLTGDIIVTAGSISVVYTSTNS